ncbi:MAG: DUF4870 domain-containing protein [Ignavibacteria bacterium]
MDQGTEQNSATQTEKLLGLFAHLSVFFGRLIIPFIIWVVNRKKSKFVTFHSLQALFFHLALTFVNVIVGMFGGVILGIYSGITKHNLDKVSNWTPFQIIILVAIAIFVFINLIYSFVVGVMNSLSAYQGELKKYPIIGNIVYKKVYGLN